MRVGTPRCLAVSLPMPLEDFYSGDDAFDRLARARDADFDAAWQAWPQRPALIEACNQCALLAKVIYRVAGAHALEYMDARPPVLDGLSPRQCLESERHIRRLKEALLRSP